MNRYRVGFTSTSAEVEADNEDEAIEKAKTLLYNGELYVEVESVIEVEEG